MEILVVAIMIVKIRTLSDSLIHADAEFDIKKRIHSFIHSAHFYSAPSSPILLRGAPNYSTDTVSEFHAEAHRQL